MNSAIDVNATFNTIGEIKPVFVRLEDKNHELHTYKIDKILDKKIEQYSGIQSILFSCSIQISDRNQIIQIRYYIHSHKWVILNDS